MVFSSFVFLFAFLPLVLLLYYICPAKLRNLVLLLASLLFYAWGEPVYVLIMLFSTVFDYTNGRLIAHFKKKGAAGKAKLFLVIDVCGNLGILGFFKYTDFLIGTVNSLTGAGLSLLYIALPIGISFYTFQTMSYTIDVYRGVVPAQKNILNFAMGNNSVMDKVYPSNNAQIRMGDIIIQGNADRQTVSEIRREQRESLKNLLKEFNKLK